MPPTARFVISFAAEPSQDKLPYGRWAEVLAEHFLAACLRAQVAEEDEEAGTPGEILWFPDRTWCGRTYVPATAMSESGHEYFGHVSYTRDEDGEPIDFASGADVTAETAAANPDWELDLNEEVIGSWRGERGRTADITLVWGRPMKTGGVVVTAELADLAVDQCELEEGGRFSLVAADAYRGDYLDIKLWDRGGKQLASESLYVDDGEDD